MKTYQSIKADPRSGLFGKTIWLMALVAMFLVSPLASAAETWPLLAGQSTDVGTVVVDHDINAGQVSVTYTLTDPNATFGTLHLWVGNQTNFDNLDKSNRPAPGKSPYSFNATGLTTHTFTVDLADVFAEADACGKDIYVIPHAEINYANGGNDTAYGFEFDGKDKFNARNKKGAAVGAWWYYGVYNVVCTPPTEDDQACYSYKGETAWADGSRYVNPGNWATYTAYVAGTTVDLFAGQTLDAGSVTFSAVNNGKVTITIDIAAGWRFAPVAENVKIQGYNEAPSGNPAPGNFTTHKAQASGASYTVDVDAFNFYGVHVDVEKVTPVACPVTQPE
ncbi:MAG: hypothetical protein Q7U38_09130 [Methylobacter sp.]|nr:hypothetical protein [Methylobacter sp.]MDP2100017.1 hypothetical protein [Methylobacter sp.]MDP2427982.1 hypothetical protein [Methylobacter sp.]MDP3055827.1 hypothetical protein [Methylobacter sp.]MDP3363490.1 hypothetical protein [Methylobacter sp.]